MEPEERAAFLAHERMVKLIVGAVVAAIVVAIVVAGALHKSPSSSSGSGDGGAASASDCSLGGIVTLQDTGKEIPAGDTRTDLNKIEDSLAAKDDTGLANELLAGQLVSVGEGAQGRLIDTALLGERQVRIISDAAHPENIGVAVWVDSSVLEGC